VAELERWLTARGVEDDDVRAVSGHLTESGQLDDHRFAYRFAADKRELAGWGPDRIQSALARRGVAQDLSEAALAEESASEQVERAAASLAERGTPASDDRLRAQALAFLTRRGFDYEIAYEAVRRHARSDDLAGP